MQSCRDTVPLGLSPLSMETLSLVGKVSQHDLNSKEQEGPLQQPFFSKWRHRGSFLRFINVQTLIQTLLSEESPVGQLAASQLLPPAGRSEDLQGGWTPLCLLIPQQGQGAGGEGWGTRTGTLSCVPIPGLRSPCP